VLLVDCALRAGVERDQRATFGWLDVAVVVQVDGLAVQLVVFFEYFLDAARVVYRVGHGLPH
jgi:hypothetical protein